MNLAAAASALADGVELIVVLAAWEREQLGLKFGQPRRAFGEEHLTGLCIVVEPRTRPGWGS
jgi:hypothetical protein